MIVISFRFISGWEFEITQQIVILILSIFKNIDPCLMGVHMGC